STTLFSMLSMLNKENVNIVTLEDPVEYIIQGVNHSQVRPEIGYTFANGIRSFLRQDPDIIMVGEIRDNETAELCVHAGLTGHLVLTTLHTNSAIGAIPRLFDMKVEPFLLSSSLNLIISQRLVRRICDQCRTELIVDSNMIDKIKEKIKNISPDILKKNKINVNNLKFYKGKGCPHCSNTGYKGRIAMMEVIKITDDIRKIIETDKSINNIEPELKKQNFIPIIDDGIIKALKGLITLEDCFNSIDE
ncbi:MAG: ATPase, T2SS/T4P/T4SS family, partial [Patescibacteria group bacterium]